MTSDAPPFLSRFWWLPPVLLAVAMAVAAWVYRERPLNLQSLPASVLASTAAIESELGDPPPRMVEYRARVSTDVQGRRSVTTIRHLAEHLGGGWFRRSDNWFDEGATTWTYQERYLTHRNFLQAHRQHRGMAPLIHDLLAEFGWLGDSAIAQTLISAGRFPWEAGSSISVRQSRIAQIDEANLVAKETPYERTIECQRDGVVEGSTLGPALSGPLVRVACRSNRSHLSGETKNVFVWHSEAKLFLLIESQQPSALGGVETQTRLIEALSITP